MLFSTRREGFFFPSRVGDSTIRWHWPFKPPRVVALVVPWSLERGTDSFIITWWWRLLILCPVSGGGKTAALPSGARTLLRLIVFIVENYSHRWMPISTPYSVWQAVLISEVAPTLVEVLWAQHQLSLALTWLSPGILSFPPSLGLASTDVMSLPSVAPTKHGFVLFRFNIISWRYAMFLIFLVFHVANLRLVGATVSPNGDCSALTKWDAKRRGRLQNRLLVRAM